MLVSFGKAGWIGKAMQQPERIRTVVDKIRTDGIRPTLKAVFHKLGKPIPLGYSNAGTVIEVGSGVTGLRVGDRVVSNGPHAAVVAVPQNLAAKIPDGVSDEAASFTVIGAIALQGIRLVQPSFGETVAVIGLGLIGQLTIQLLKANGCRVIGIDTDAARCALAARSGITTLQAGAGPVAAQVNALTGGTGADAVIITASASGDDIISDAAQMSRKRGRIVLVGVVGLHIRRSDFYEKELSFQVSCSYGPGRYDYAYEQKGIDYPLPYVRWTEQRNFEAVLQALAIGQLHIEELVSQRSPIEDYAGVYQALEQSGNIASVFTYPDAAPLNRTIHFEQRRQEAGSGKTGIIGAGNFTGSVILPALKKAGAVIAGIVSEQGLNAAMLAKQAGIPMAGTDATVLLSDKAIDAVLIATRHDSHADLCLAALQQGKHVFVEKPLALNQQELDAVTEAYAVSGKTLTVGFNRRHAPLAQQMKALLSDAPMNITVTVNAGTLEAKSWLNDPEVSGGRIIGEACHFIDLCAFISGSEVTHVCAAGMAAGTEDASIMLRYANGAHAVIHYFTNGSKAYDKERVEVYQAGRTLVLENWRKLTGYGFSGFKNTSAPQDKGHTRQFALWQACISKGAAAPIPFQSLYNTSKTAIAATESLRDHCWKEI
jgi:predicted dehydrogenase/threonine dehydrogenase-like Zn-dependent dehydrogenase